MSNLDRSRHYCMHGEALTILRERRELMRAREAIVAVEDDEGRNEGAGGGIRCWGRIKRDASASEWGHPASSLGPLALRFRLTRHDALSLAAHNDAHRPNNPFLCASACFRL